MSTVVCLINGIGVLYSGALLHTGLTINNANILYVFMHVYAMHIFKRVIRSV